MKKFFPKFLPLFTMALCVLCCLPACSDDDEGGQAPVSPIVGTWVESDKQDDVTIITSFTFRADGSGVVNERVESEGTGVSIDPLNFTYTFNADTETIRLKFDGDGTLYSGTASITGNTLVLRYNNTYYNLRRQ